MPDLADSKIIDYIMAGTCSLMGITMAGAMVSLLVIETRKGIRNIKKTRKVNRLIPSSLLKKTEQRGKYTLLMNGWDKHGFSTEHIIPYDLQLDPEEAARLHSERVDPKDYDQNRITYTGYSKEFDYDWNSVALERELTLQGTIEDHQFTDSGLELRVTTLGQEIVLGIENRHTKRTDIHNTHVTSLDPQRQEQYTVPNCRSFSGTIPTTFYFKFTEPDEQVEHYIQMLDELTDELLLAHVMARWGKSNPFKHLTLYNQDKKPVVRFEHNPVTQFGLYTPI